MEAESFLPLGRGCQLLAFGVIRSRCAVGRGDDDLALGDGRGGRHGRGGFVYPDSLAAGEIEPVDAAVVGPDEYAAAGDRWRRVDAARVVNVQSGLPVFASSACTILSRPQLRWTPFAY
jgi:hypothetical protein